MAKSTAKAKAPVAKKATKKVVKKPEVVKTKTPQAVAPQAAASNSSGVVITSNKVCNAFKTRAEKLCEAIKKAKPSASVTVNHEAPLGRNPDRGTFSVVCAGVTVVHCPNMPRPFTTMKALDMDEVAKKTIALL